MRSLAGLCCALLVALALGLCRFSPRRAAASNFTVNDLADTPDALRSDGVCADARGACTLRAAIQQANADPSGDIVGFDINGTIELTGALPDISTDVTLNGPGAAGPGAGGGGVLNSGTLSMTGFTVNEACGSPHGVYASRGVTSELTSGEVRRAARLVVRGG